MNRSLKTRILRLDAAAREKRHADETWHRPILRSLAKSVLAYFPDLALVEVCDTDPETFREIEEDRAWARGDVETAERLRAAAPAEPDWSEGLTDRREMMAAHAAYLNRAMKATPARARATNRAMAAARKRLGRKVAQLGRPGRYSLEPDDQ